MWKKVCNKEDIPINGGACVKEGDTQIAVFSYDDGKVFYAIDNLCPHSNQNVLSRGIVGDRKGEPKVSCPLHKKSFSLKRGHCLDSDEELSVKRYEVDIRGNEIYLCIPE
ncbi:MAG: nitrite reductase (NAD(P)H) small subunit [Planctomycetota bacterium]|nr:MAG: nitrite reductase (NAD(P)H) small subunit [Planctomycetota bacterium]